MSGSHDVVRKLSVLLLAIAVAGCGAGPAGEQGAPAAGTETETETENLQPPFTAEQIRDEWTPGLTIVFHFLFPDREERHRWTVVEADAEAVLIQYLPLDEQGQPAGPPEHAPSRWTELRDHALFPAVDARRERVSRETALGTFDGWLYTVHDPRAETMSRYFFADELPGAPLWMETRSGEQLLLSLSQIARQRLPGPPEADPETAPEQG